MSSTLLTTGPLDEVRRAAAELDVAHDVEATPFWDEWDVAVDIFSDADYEGLAVRLEAILNRPVKTLESVE